MRDKGVAKSMREWLTAAALAMLLAALASAWAGDFADGPYRSGAGVVLLPPIESGKPLRPPPASNFSQGQAEACLSPLPCGARLLGAARKNGAVELQIPALRW